MQRRAILEYKDYCNNPVLHALTLETLVLKRCDVQQRYCVNNLKKPNNHDLAMEKINKAHDVCKFDRERGVFFFEKKYLGGP